MKPWDQNYFSTEAQEVEREIKTTMRAALGTPYLNHEEAEVHAEMIEAIAKLKLDRVGFEITDEETGEIVVLTPSLTADEHQLLRVIHETYRPLLTAARAKGKDNR